MGKGELLELFTYSPVKMLQPRPMRQSASPCLGLQSAGDRTVERHFKPAFDLAERKAAAQVLIVEPVAKEQVDGLAGGAPRPPVDGKCIKKSVCLAIKPAPETGFARFWDTGERER